MASVSKRAPILVFAAVFLALCLIGWVARVSLAQDAKQEPAPPHLPAATSAEPAATPQDVLVAPSDATQPPPAADTAKPPALGLPEPQLLGSTKR